MTFKVTAHIYDHTSPKGGFAGRMVFVSNDYLLANQIAANGPDNLPENYQANVDFEMAVPLGRRRIWVDCNTHALEQAAETLMQAAQNIRNERKPRVA